MASFPTGTTPFLLEIQSAQGSSAQEIPRTPKWPNDAADQEAGWYFLIRLIGGSDERKTKKEPQMKHAKI
jgi:hypothetical protein